MKKLVLRVLLGVLIVIVVILLYFTYLYFNISKVSEGTPIQAYEQPNSALLVIDVQEGTTGDLSEYPELKEQSQELIENINQLIQRAEMLKYPVIYITQETTNWLLNAATNYALARGEPGAEIDYRVMVVSENIFPKESMDAFSNPDLDEYLRKNQVDHLYITGLDAAGCAMKTTLGALNRGYKVSLVQNALISKSEEKKQEALAELESKGAKLLKGLQRQDK